MIPIIESFNISFSIFRYSSLNPPSTIRGLFIISFNRSIQPPNIFSSKYFSFTPNILNPKTWCSPRFDVPAFRYEPYSSSSLFVNWPSVLYLSQPLFKMPGSRAFFVTSFLSNSLSIYTLTKFVLNLLSGINVSFTFFPISNVFKFFMY